MVPWAMWISCKHRRCRRLGARRRFLAGDSKANSLLRGRRQRRSSLALPAKTTSSGEAETICSRAGGATMISGRATPAMTSLYSGPGLDKLYGEKAMTLFTPKGASGIRCVSPESGGGEATTHSTSRASGSDAGISRRSGNRPFCFPERAGCVRSPTSTRRPRISMCRYSASSISPICFRRPPSNADGVDITLAIPDTATCFVLPDRMSTRPTSMRTTSSCDRMQEQAVLISGAATAQER